MFRRGFMRVGRSAIQEGMEFLLLFFTKVLVDLLEIDLATYRENLILRDSSFPLIL